VLTEGETTPGSGGGGVRDAAVSAVIEVSEESLWLIPGDEVLGRAARLVDGGMAAGIA
jgi:hypothetical protein